MSEIFLSYRFTGECPKQLEYLLGNITKSLEFAGHDVFCSLFYEEFFRKKGWGYNEILDYCLEEQKKREIFMPFVKTDDLSNGMVKESVLALELGQRYVLLEKSGLYLPEFREPAHEVISYESFDDLFRIMKIFK